VIQLAVTRRRRAGVARRNGWRLLRWCGIQDTAW